MKINAYLKYAQNNGMRDSGLSRGSREMRLYLEIIGYWEFSNFFEVEGITGIVFTDGDNLGQRENWFYRRKRK